MEYELRTVKTAILPKNESLYSEQATFIEIDDESAGEFVTVFQPESTKGVKVSSEEWPMLKAAIEDMLANCRDNKPTP